jgi:hypothetical protein
MGLKDLGGVSSLLDMAADAHAAINAAQAIPREIAEFQAAAREAAALPHAIAYAQSALTAVSAADQIVRLRRTDVESLQKAVAEFGAIQSAHSDLVSGGMCLTESSVNNHAKSSVPAVKSSRKSAPTFEERTQNASKSLSPLYDDLNKTWHAVEIKLRKMLPPRHTWVPYRFEVDEVDSSRQMGVWDCLGLVKYRGEWRVCNGRYHTLNESAPGTWKPITECAVEERVAAVDHVEALKEEILAGAEKSIPIVQSAVAKLAKTLAQI